MTHDMEWVREYCNRAMLLEKGRVILEGDPEEVVQLHLERTAAAAAARQAEALAKGLTPPRSPAGAAGAAAPTLGQPVRDLSASAGPTARDDATDQPRDGAERDRSPPIQEHAHVAGHPPGERP